MVHAYMVLKVEGLDCITASGFRVGITGLVFGFKSAPLALEQVPTCIQKPRKIPLISQLSFDIDCFLVVLDGFRSFLDPLGRFRSFKLVSHFSKYHKICSSSC